MSENQPRKHSGGLTVWLLLILVGNALLVLSYISAFFLFSPKELNGIMSFAGTPLWSLPFFMFYSIVSIISVIALFTWRKWGFYAIFLSTIAELITHTVIRIIPFGTLVDCVSIFVLYILLRPEWNLFQSVTKNLEKAKNKIV